MSQVAVIYISSSKQLRIDDIEEDKGERESLWESTFFHDAFLLDQKKEREARKYANKPRKDYGDDLQRAKSYPIHQLLKFDKQGNTRCIFHNEKTASLHYYPETNTCYCFGSCGKSFDAIDIYMKLHNVTFKEAVKKLKE